MANRNYEELPLTFEKGLVTEIEESVLDVGQSSELVNWEPATYGGLRVRNAYSSITTDGLTAPYRVRGFGSIATGTAIAGAVTAPQVIQADHWPNADSDPTMSRTATLNGISIGNVLIAVVTDDSDLTPTVTSGWTQRAVSTGDRQHVKFYTHTADTSTEVFTYTISQARIRSMSVYEVRYLDSEDPGTKWAADSVTSGSPGSSTITANAVDSDGGLALVGYCFNGGTANSSSSGTSGYATPSLDNENTRQGVAFEDLDQLDGTQVNNALDTTNTYVSPSWTPPSTGVVIVIAAVVDDAGGANNFSAMSVTGNGLTWHDCLDGGELGNLSDLSGIGAVGYAWADCAETVGTAGAVTVSTTSGANTTGIMCSFVLARGADTTTPFIDEGINNFTLSGTPTGVSLGTLFAESGTLGFCVEHDDEPPSGVPQPVAFIDPTSWQRQLDALSMDVAPPGISFGTAMLTTACSDSSFPPVANGKFTGASGDAACLIGGWQIKGAGTQAKHYRDGLTGTGTAIEGFSWIADKEMTVKMVLWGFTPPPVSPDTVDFYLVMALAQDSTTYKIYQIPRDDVTTGTWELLDTVTDALTNSALVSFAQGAGHLIWTASTLNYPRSIELATLSASNLADMQSLAGRTVAYHKDRLFMAGSTQNPSRLYFSQIGEPTEFVTATDFIDIGGDDGEAIQDLSSVEGLLLVPKTNRAYLISGSGVESFFVNELSGGTAAVGRSAVRTPYGTILAGDDDVWVVQGGGTDPMSRPLGGGYDIQGAVSTSYAQDMALIADTGRAGRVWRVNLVTGAWSEETTSNGSLEEAVYITFSLNGRLYYGTNDSDSQVGGTRRLTSARNYDETTNAIDFHAATGRMAMFGPQVRYTPRHLYLQLRLHDTDKPNVLFLTVETNIGSRDFHYDVTQETQREYLSVGWAKGIEWVKFSFSADSSPEHSAIDIEKAVLSVATEDY